MSTSRISEQPGATWTDQPSTAHPDAQLTGGGWESDRVAEGAQRVVAAVEQVVLGKPHVVRTAVMTLIAGGHLLVEDVPGVGKTVLAKALARAVDCSVSRVQFTPDLLPSDVTGVTVYDRRTAEFDFRPGPVFANMVVADEINRASPKTQSALLECMEEHQVTVDSTTYSLAEPFMVLATQNPVEMEGTYPLPEAQRDRFTTRISLGYPHPEAELAMIDTHSSSDPVERVRPVCTAADVRAMIDAARSVHMSPELQRYVVELVSNTRSSPHVRLGASPRATLHLVRSARAWAAMAGRTHVLPDDVKEVGAAVLSHRLLLTPQARGSGPTPGEVVSQLLAKLVVPRGHPARHGQR